MFDEKVLLAFLITFLAGLSTAIGGLISFFAKKTNTRFLSIALGFSAGVMIYVSMIEIFQEANVVLINHFGNTGGRWITAAAFFVGILIMLIIWCLSKTPFIAEY